MSASSSFSNRRKHAIASLYKCQLSHNFHCSMCCAWCQKFLKNGAIKHIINAVSQSDIFTLLQCLRVCLCIPYFLGVNIIANNKPSVKCDSSSQRSQCICFCSLATQGILLDTGNLCMLTVLKPSYSTATSKSQSRDNTSVHVWKCVWMRECACVATAPLSCPFLKAPQCIYRCCILCALSNK